MMELSKRENLAQRNDYDSDFLLFAGIRLIYC
jgi:hypothetical protein